MPGQRALFLSRRPIHLDVKCYQYPMGWKSEKLNPLCSQARFQDVPGLQYQKNLHVGLMCCRGTHNIKDSTHTVRYYPLEDSVLLLR